MKKINLVILVIGLVLIGLIFSVRLFTSEDTWICQDGQWIKHGQPRDPQPTSPCPSQNEPLDNPISVETPFPNQTLSSPINIKGQARGNWYFEASFPIILKDTQENMISQAVATAKSDWMTEDFVPFEASLDFSVPEETLAILVLKKDNPSGLAKYDQEITIPITLLPDSQSQVKVYFNNNKLDSTLSCEQVFSVNRTVAKTQAIARAALEELLAGPTDEEKAAGFDTTINPGVVINSLSIENGVAKVDFSDELEKAVGGSCRVSLIRKQIEETLKQFSTISQVLISINGRTEDILQP